MDTTTTETEVWRPVAEMENAVEVSSLGRVRTKDRTILQRNGGRRSFPGVVLKAAKLPSGYWYVGLRYAGEYIHRSVHRLVAAAFIGPRPPGLQVRHLDGCKDNNAASNLAYGTPAQNQLDRITHGTSNRGERCPTGKLTESDVRAIREMRRGGALHREIAARFGVARNTISVILSGTNWGWLT